MGQAHPFDGFLDATVRELVDRLPLEIHPLDADVAEGAASLRAQHRTLRLPDALVIATADRLRADHLVTTEQGWPSRARLKVSTTITVL